MRFGPDLGTSPIDGRLLLILSKDPAEEPRLQINDSPKTQQIFGIDVEGLEPGHDAVIGPTALGYPMQSLAQDARWEILGPGRTPQVRELFTEPTGTPSSCRWIAAKVSSGARLPETFTAHPGSSQSIPGSRRALTITLDKVIPPIPAPATTKYIKHETIQSERLTRFWGRPMHLGAHVLLPRRI